MERACWPASEESIMSIPTISPEQLAELCNQRPQINLIDVRTPAEYRALHLEAARNVPLEILDPAALIREFAVSDSDPLYVICASGSRGRQACERLVQAGINNVLNIEGGTTACVKAGLPVLRGKSSVSLERQVRMTAGSIVLVGTLLGLLHPAFLVVPGFIGAGLLFSGITDTCGMAMMLARMPWNRCGSIPA
jgi:rhodanese-related sulfurtransferase